MRDCNEITIEGMRTLLHALKTKICYLDMEDCHKLGPECLPSGINKLKVLKIGFQKRKGKLESGNIVEHLTRGKHLIAPKLEWLSVQHRETQSLGSIERLGATLTALDLRGCTDIPQSEYKKCAELPELKQLLTGTGITSEILCSIVHACKKLEVLDITGSELSKECIEGICNNLKSLQKLKLAKCKSLTNDGVQRILASLPNLRLIDLSHCWKLSDALCNHMPPLAATGENSSPNIHKIQMN
uniref:Uncharacterized protein n=1 Tax=Babesia bovis TaxID=5865 RepID=A7ASW1_BABBO|eukprot:XP_001609590.1 hypothetical protein [Babesia bovis T2Bo]